MDKFSRIRSLLSTPTLDFTSEGLSSFQLSNLKIKELPDVNVSERIRLGHLIEKLASACIQTSSNYELLYQNFQVKEDKTTIGEIDFILEDLETKQQTHLELAYKFYLYDPNISNDQQRNWIGPNRNDSLIQKLDKLRSKQFPLLYRESAKAILPKVDFNSINQKLCLMANLFIPYQFSGEIIPIYHHAIKGYYMNYETFLDLNQDGQSYFLPPKKDWGINPSEGETWEDFEQIKEQIEMNLNKNQAPLCWQKHKDSYTQYFVIWW
jgi:hypothetical protein